MIIQDYPDELDYVNAQLHPLVRDADDKSFLGTFCQACLRADAENYELLRPLLIFFMVKYPANPERLRMERHESRGEPVKVEAHFVTFYSPGTFVAEYRDMPIPAWDIEKAKAMALGIKERHGATPYGFRFSTRTRGDEDLDSKVTVRSPFYWLGGTVETLEQVKARATDRDRILIANMEGNKWDRIITNNNSYAWTQPLYPTDVVLDWPPATNHESPVT